MNIISKSICPSLKGCDKYVCHKYIGVANMIKDENIFIYNMPNRIKPINTGYIGAWKILKKLII